MKSELIDDGCPSIFQTCAIVVKRTWVFMVR